MLMVRRFCTLTALPQACKKRLEETERRRAKQMAYNGDMVSRRHPLAVRLPIKSTQARQKPPNDNQAIVVTHAFPDVDISILRSPDLLSKEIAPRKEMKALSCDLKFEEAREGWILFCK